MIVFYRRVSTDKQDESLEAQERRGLDYIAYKFRERGLQSASAAPPADAPPSATIFGDADSARKLRVCEREGGLAMMRALETALDAGDKDLHLVITKLDRLWRNSFDFNWFLLWMKQRGIALHIVDFGGDSLTTQGHYGEMVLKILAAIAEAEALEIRDRTLKIMHEKRRRGELCNHVPFGQEVVYTFADGHTDTRRTALFFGGKERRRRRDGVDVKSSEPDPEASALLAAHGAVVSKLLRDDPETQHWLGQMQDWRAAGLGYTAIATRLRHAGAPTQNGGTWSAGNVHGILKNLARRNTGKP